MVIGKTNVRNRQISPNVRKNPVGKFSILKLLDIPGTEQFLWMRSKQKEFFRLLNTCLPFTVQYVITSVTDQRNDTMFGGESF
jgi:hypothetical protein